MEARRQAPVADQLAHGIHAIVRSGVPHEVKTTCEALLIDVGGLCVAARQSDYIRSLLASVDRTGPCTAIGHPGGFSAEDAAMVNGTAAHGEDFDDTFEGGPVHSGAVIVPAVAAACERFALHGRSALVGIAAGVEVMCRLSLAAPKLIHQAGFHPTAVLGAMASTAAVGATMGLEPSQLVDALGVAGSMASGIIEYLTEGAWTKRLHAGWAARVGVHAARLGQQGFRGPRTVFEGTHGLFFAFAHTRSADFSTVLDDFGQRWCMTGITFKPYATGTMNQPYVDCAKRLARHGFAADDVAEVLCETAAGYVQRLWEPLAHKQGPPNEYAAKFSAPFNVAVAFVTGGAGLSEFTEARLHDPQILALASKVRYVVDPENPYPQSYTGHVRMTLKDGRVFEERQPHIRGGVHEPLTRRELEEKFLRNARHGGWSQSESDRYLAFAKKAYEGPLDLSHFRE